MRKINKNKNKQLLCAIAYSISAFLLGGGIGLGSCGLISQIYLLRVGLLSQTTALCTTILLVAGLVMASIGGVMYTSLPEKVKESQ